MRFFIPLLIFASLLFALPVVSAFASTDVEVHYEPVMDRDALIFNVTMPYGDYATFSYEYFIFTGIGTATYPDPSLLSTYTGDFYHGNMTGLSQTFTMTPHYFAFDGMPYSVSLAVWEHWRSNGTIHETYTNMFNLSSFNVSIPDQVMLHHVSFSNAYPPYLSLYGGDAITQGFEMNATCLDSTGNYTLQPVYFFITDNSSSRNLLAWTSRTIHYKPAFTKDLSALWNTTGQVFGYGTEWLNELIRYNGFEYYTSYYIYIGVPDDPDTMLTVIDDTLLPVNFSVSEIAGVYTTFSDVSEYTTVWGAGNHFIGAMAYFETNPSIYGAGWRPGGGSGGFDLGTALDGYGASIGIPFFSILIAFMVCAICAVIPWRLAVKYEFQLPNFVYTFAVIGGIVLDFSLNIIDLWMFALFILVIVFTAFLRYREEIEKTIGVVTGRPVSLRATAFGAEAEHERRYLMPTAKGIASRFLSKDVGARKPKTSWTDREVKKWPSQAARDAYYKDKSKRESQVLVTEKQGRQIKMKTETVTEKERRKVRR
jgi:hypothetical protein